jgi:hypothetical protein
MEPSRYDYCVFVDIQFQVVILFEMNDSPEYTFANDTNIDFLYAVLENHANNP